MWFGALRTCRARFVQAHRTHLPLIVQGSCHFVASDTTSLVQPVIDRISGSNSL
jgi:hypothetical protein